MTIKSFLQKTFYKVADPVLTGIAHPFKVASAIISPTKKVSDVSKEFFSQTKPQQIAQTIISGVNVALAGVGAGAVATKGALAVASSITTKKVLAGGGILAIEGAVSRKPEQSVAVAQNTISGLPQFGGNVAELVTNPSLSQAQKTFTDNPFITGGAVLGGLGLTGYALSTASNVYATSQNTKAINKSLGQGQNINSFVPEGSLSYSDQKNLLQEQAQQERKTLEAQTEAQFKLNKQAFEQQKELSSSSGAPVPITDVAPKTSKKKKKSKKKSKKKTKKKKKKTRRSKKKTKKKSIKRRKN